MSPARRRRAVEHLQAVFGVSQRWACQLVGQHRSTQRHQPLQPGRDRALREELRRLSRAHPRWGYRRAHAVLREQGWAVNRKVIQRLWREEGLRVPSQRRKRQRLGVSTTPADRLGAEHPNHVWALDYQFDQTTDGRLLKLLNVVDEHTRVALAIQVERRIDADATVAVLDRLVTERRTVPRFVRCDNGPELTANALRDWCRFTGAGTSYIEPGSPWQNPYVESFGGRLRDELLAVEAFSTLLEARVLVEDWRIEYNTTRPHSALGYCTPAQYARAWTSTNPHSHNRWTNNQGPVTTMELVALRRPFVYFPLRRHWEQQHHVAHRLDHYRAGIGLDYATTTPSDLAVAMRSALTLTPRYRPVPQGGARQAAHRIVRLLLQ